MQTPLQLSGRMFSDDDILWLKTTISNQKDICRESLARSFCQYAGWHKPDGGLKDMSCKMALLKLQKMGLLTLPEPRSATLSGQMKRFWRFWAFVRLPGKWLHGIRLSAGVLKKDKRICIWWSITAGS